MKEKLNLFDNEKYKKFLPSKKFAVVMGISLSALIVIFLIFFASSKAINFVSEKSKNNILLNMGDSGTVNDIIQRDSDGDGVLDWEEALWGTDKNKKVTFDNMPDAIYIENKKRELKIEQEIITETEDLTETDKFAKQFFASYISMKSAGGIDNNTINDFSTSLGQKIISPSMLNVYSEKDIKISTGNNIDSQIAYYNKIRKQFQSYEAIGDELDIVSDGLTSYSQTGEENQEYNQLLIIGNEYQDFAKYIIETAVPESLVQYALKIANNSNNTGISLENMTKIINDPIVGLSAISAYQQYSDDLAQSVEDLEARLEIN